MKMDLAAAAQKWNGTTGGVRAVWKGGRVELDETKYVDLIARGVAAAMGANIHNGLRPDGKGPMPGRKKDGRPRGQDSLISRALAALQIGPRTWIIAAHQERLGHLARILQEVPFLPPPIEWIRDFVHAAFEAAVKLSTATAALRSLADADAGVRRVGRLATSEIREQYRAAIRNLGVGEKSRLAKRIRSASRQLVRGGTR